MAYIFPPLARAGVHRTVRFVRYLAPLGWDITVLTPDESYYPVNSPIDRELLKKIPASVKVEPTKIFRGVTKILELKARHAGKSHKPPIRESNREERLKPSDAGTAHSNDHRLGEAVQTRRGQEGRRRHFFQRGKDFLSELMSIPDKDVTWLPYAFPAALRLHRREHFDVIYSTAPPFTGHLVAYLVKKVTGLPWVADFRDPWARAPWKAELMNGTLRGRAADKLEAKFVRAADRVILNTDWAARDFSEFYGAAIAQKFVVIPNGFDPEDFAGVQFPQKKNKKLVITHTGSLYRKRDPLQFFDAVGKLVASGQIKPEELELRFVGGIAPELYRSFQYAEALQHVLHVIPPVSHREALAFQAESDVLLILQPGTSVSVPGKIYEYIAMRKKILALTPAGATADVVRNYNLGFVVDPEDRVGIQRALLQLVSEFRNGGLAPIPADGAFSKYDGVTLTKQLHEELRGCIAPRHKPPVKNYCSAASS
ncbi:MAG: glycosyltransferase [candidate division KSB1 bacterium]|nr:glycosyltransferase [candidate division KSB1 bacterium]